jgi:hypothetical protein
MIRDRMDSITGASRSDFKAHDPDLGYGDGACRYPLGERSDNSFAQRLLSRAPNLDNVIVLDKRCPDISTKLKRRRAADVRNTVLTKILST